MTQKNGGNKHNRKAFGIFFVLVTLAIPIMLASNSISAQENKNSITVVAWNSDSTHIAVGYANGQIEIVSADGQVRQVLQQATGKWINDLAWHPDGDTIASGSDNSNIRLWDISVGSTIELPSPTQFPVDYLSLFWLANGSELLAISVGEKPNVFIWDIATTEVVFSASIGSLYDPQLNSDGTFIVSGTGATSLALVSVGDGLIGQPIGEPRFLSVIGEQMYAAAWSPDETQAAGGTASGRVEVWDVAAEQLMMNVGGDNYDVDTWEQSIIVELMFTPDGERIQALDGSGMFRVWAIATAELVLEEQLPVTSMPISAAEISPDGMQIAYGDQSGTLTIVELPSNNIPPEPTAGPDQTVTASSGGTAVVTLDGSGSSDSDGTITTYRWYENDVLIAEGVTPQVELGVGEHTITLEVEDDDGATDSDDVIITVEPASGCTITAPADPPTYTVAVGDVTGLIVAIDASNANPDPDLIALEEGTYTLTTGINTWYGKSGLPAITTSITFQGNCATIERDPAAEAFRFFQISSGGNLILYDLTLTGGDGGSTNGGAIYSQGTVTATNTTIANSTAAPVAIRDPMSTQSLTLILVQ